MALATLSIDLEARIAKFQEGMDKAARLTEQHASKFDKINERLRGVGELAAVAAGRGALAAGAAGAAFVKFVASTAEGIDALNDVKDATGASIENISALENVALRTGASLDDVSGILVKFNDVLSQAKPGSGAEATLKAIGLNAEELRRLDPAEALQKTAQALAGFADDGNKARIVQDLFGKSVKEAAPFLADLAAQQGLQATVTREQAEAATEFNNRIASLKTDLLQLSREVTSTVLPVINELVASMRSTGVGAFGVGNAVYEKAQALEKARVHLKRLEDDLAIASQGGVRASFLDDPDTLRSQIAEAQKRVRAAQTDFYGTSGVEGGRGVLNPAPALQATLPDMARLTAPKSSKAGRASGIGADPMDKYRDGLLARITEEWDQVGEAQRAALADLDAYIEKLGGEKDRATEQAMSRAQQYYEQAMTPAERLRAAQAEINKLWEQGAFVSDALATADQKRAAALAEISRQYEEQQDKLGALSDVAKSFSDVLMRAVENGDDLAKGLERIAMKALVFDPLSKGIEQMFSSLASAMTSSGGGAGPAGGGGVDLASLAIKVGSMFFGGFFAEGGEPPVGKVSVVGERGPELFIPKSAGSVVPNHALGGTTVQVVNHVTAGAQIGHADLAAAMAVTKQQTEASVLRMLRGRGVAV